MIYIKDLDIREVESKSGKINRHRFALFECPKCGGLAERKKHDGIKQKKCCGGSFKHGKAGDPIHTRYSGMMQRCNDKNAINYRHYGGRGITVCKEWMNFDNFAKWSIANGFSSDKDLDRIDNSKGYSPENCRYISRARNCQNTRRNIHSESDIKEIKRLYVTTPVSTSELALMFNDSRGNISNILTDRRWDIPTEWDVYIDRVAEVKRLLPPKLRKMWNTKS